jgi:hypothetical protein
MMAEEGPAFFLVPDNNNNNNKGAPTTTTHNSHRFLLHHHIASAYEAAAMGGASKGAPLRLSRAQQAKSSMTSLLLLMISLFACFYTAGRCASCLLPIIISDVPISLRVLLLSFFPFFFWSLSPIFFHFFFLSSFFLRTVFFFLWGDAPFSMNSAPRLWCFFPIHCVGTKFLELILFSFASEYVFDCFFGFCCNFLFYFLLRIL